MAEQRRGQCVSKAVQCTTGLFAQIENGLWEMTSMIQLRYRYIIYMQCARIYKHIFKKANWHDLNQ